MGKTDKKRRMYRKEFKAKAVALAEKQEKPIIPVARDVGINDTILYRWMQVSREAPWGREAALSRTRTVPGRGVGLAEEGEQGTEGCGVKLRFT
jgi:transposase-like protein